MGFSYSKVGTYDTCPYQYKLRYLDKLEPLPDTNPNSALFLGTAIHEGIEKRSIEAALESYRSNYTESTKHHEIAEIKLRAILEKAIKQVPEGEYEHKLLADDGFIGFIDCLVPVEDGVYDLLDFKYSNNLNGYSNSGQVHLYKYYFEKLTDNKIRDLYYVFIPKCADQLNESMSNEESLVEKIKQHALANDVKMVKIEYDPRQVGWFFGKKYRMDHDKEFNKRYSSKCSWCDYRKFCESRGVDTSELTEESKQKLEEHNDEQGTV